eukprot:scaffold26532_cov56-Attheya_sp.AAC.3
MGMSQSEFGMVLAKLLNARYYYKTIKSRYPAKYAQLHLGHESPLLVTSVAYIRICKASIAGFERNQAPKRLC